MNLSVTEQHWWGLMNWRAWIQELRVREETRNPDIIVRELVEEEFRHRIDLQDIRFEDGVLELKGDCRSIGAAHSLLCKVQKIRGVKTINNQLRITPQW